jgi:hypothetical protein
VYDKLSAFLQAAQAQVAAAEEQQAQAQPPGEQNA